MSGTGGSPQRETSITENPPLNGGGEAENIGAGVTESKSPTDMKQMSGPGMNPVPSSGGNPGEALSPNSSSRPGQGMPAPSRGGGPGLGGGGGNQQYQNRGPPGGGGGMQGMRSPSGGQGGGWGQPSQSGYNNRPMNRYGGGHNDMAQGYGSYQGRPYHNQQETLSKTNLYIRGLTPTTSDQDLINLCHQYGKITSTKAIVDQATNKCKGYGFVDFEKQQEAERAVQELQRAGIQAQMAKVRESAGSEQDPTNLYIANLPQFVEESYLESMVRPYGNVVSVRILRDHMGQSRGVGFCRMESREVCERIVQELNKKTIPRSKEPLLVKFADAGNRRRRDFRHQQGMMGYDGMQHGHMGGQMMGQGGMAMNARYSMPVNNQSNYMQGAGGNWGGVPMYPQVAMSPVNPNTSMQSNIMDPTTVLAQQLGQMQIAPGQSYGMQQNPQSYPQMYQSQGMMPQFQYEVAPSPPNQLGHGGLEDHSGYQSFGGGPGQI